MTLTYRRNVLQGEQRNKALVAISKHPTYRRAHPRPDHFVPIYVAAGAGSDGSAKVVSPVYGALSIAFGVWKNSGGDFLLYKNNVQMLSFQAYL